MSEMIWLDGEYPAVHPQVKFSDFLVRNCKNSTVNHSIEKLILLHFVNFSSKLQNKFICNSVQAPWFYIFLRFYYLIRFIRFSNWYSIELSSKKVPEYDIFLKALFCTLASSVNLGLNAVPVAAGRY